MTQLKDIARVIRSKNAGPHRITFDVIFDSAEKFDQFLDSQASDLSFLAEAVGVQVSDITSSHIFRPGLAYKFTTRRPVIQGDLGETDVYGAQQHRPLMFLEVN